MKTGTIFEDTKVPIIKWFTAIFLTITHKKGVSSCQLAEDIHVTQKTAWFMLQRIRNCLNINARLCLDGKVEIDETFVGGKNKNRHWNKKVPKSQGRSFKDKTPVLGMINQDGLLITRVVKDTSKQTIAPILEKFITKGSTVYTDEWKAYNQLSSKGFKHGFIRHDRGQYADGEITTNKIESYWSHLKRCIIGIHHFVSRKYLQYYLDCQAFRYMTRQLKDCERFHLFIQHTTNRLKHKALVA